MTNAASATAREDWSEFTETGFRHLLISLKAGGYRFAGYGEPRGRKAGDDEDRHVLWRHDVDFSPHRAARLAAIESEEGARATYFVDPRAMFYNLAEYGIRGLMRTIAGYGHVFGLHFSAPPPDGRDWTQATLAQAVRRERRLVELVLDEPVGAVSWHNPDQSNLLDFGADRIGGLWNAYAARLRADYVYGSDSNGHWRYRPMDAIIAEGAPRLHLLTHPAWWTPEPMTPSDRVDRCIEGRARAVRADYDGVLARGGRLNLGRRA
jgi:hypothetical protein